MVEVVRSVCARHLWAPLTSCTAAGCLPLMANAERKETWRVWCAIFKSDSYLHFGSAGGKASNLRADTTLCSARKLDLAGSGEVFNRLRVKWNNGTTAPGRAVDP